jgi:hypothetical protein
MYYLRRRGTLMAEAEEETTFDSASASRLLSTMLTEERLRQLWLASTPQVAESIVKGWPEFAALQLSRDDASNLIAEKLRSAGGDEESVLLVLAKHFNNQKTVDVIAQKLVKARDEEAGQRLDMLLATFDSIAQKYLSREERLNSVAATTRAILKSR